MLLDRPDAAVHEVWRHLCLSAWDVPLFRGRPARLTAAWWGSEGWPAWLPEPPWLVVRIDRHDELAVVLELDRQVAMLRKPDLPDDLAEQVKRGAKRCEVVVAVMLCPVGLDIGEPAADCEAQIRNLGIISKLA